MQERWLPVPGFAGLYEVSDLGRVRNAATGTIKACRLDSDGYAVTDLNRPGVQKTAKVHHLVALAFVGPRPSAAHEIDHKNGARADNYHDNLRWVTVTENKRNLHTPCKASSGLFGVRYREGKPTPWQAHASVDGKFVSLGHFTTKKEAHAARLAHEKEFGYARATQ